MSSSPSVLGPAGGLGRLNDVLHPTGRHGRKPAQGSTMLVRGRRRRRQSRPDRRRRAVYALHASCPVPTCRPRAGSGLAPGLLAPYFSPGAACGLQGRSKARPNGTRLEYGTKSQVSWRPALVRAARPAGQLRARAARRAELWAVSRPARAKWPTASTSMCRALARGSVARAGCTSAAPYGLGVP